MNREYLRMLLGRDGQLYVVDPFNTYSSSSETLSPSSQKIRADNEESSISVLLLMSRECVQLKHPDVLERLHQLQKALKLGLDNETALNIPDSLTYEEIGKPIDEGTTKTAYTLKNHPDLLFLQLNENLEDYLTPTLDDLKLY
jgi:hypothetical protein